MRMAGLLSACCLHPCNPGSLLVPVVVIVVIVYSGCYVAQGRQAPQTMTMLAGLVAAAREVVRVILECTLRTA
jgi:hypothetical protein